MRKLPEPAEAPTVTPALNVLIPPKVCAAAVTAPPFVPSAMVRLMVLPDILRPFTLLPVIAPVDMVVHVPHVGVPVPPLKRHCPEVPARLKP